MQPPPSSLHNPKHAIISISEGNEFVGKKTDKKSPKNTNKKLTSFLGFLQNSSNLTFSLPAFCHTKRLQLLSLAACNKERLHFGLFRHSYTKML